MSETRGPDGRRRTFSWCFEEATLFIQNEFGREHQFSVQEIQNILTSLHANFEAEFFPLANNVERLGNGTELPGLGTTILDQQPGNITHAQGSSYFGVVMEECGYFEWNQKRLGIKWRLIDTDVNIDTIMARLNQGGV